MARDASDVDPLLDDLQTARLSYVTDQDPGIRRRRRGQGFSYLDVSGDVIRDEAVLDRIRKLVIPPAWTEVWICSRANGHIQATGRDQRGRKQYRYHERWRQTRDADKFDRVANFGTALPKLRRRIDADLRRHGLPREKVLATVVRLMEITLIRVGNEDYARQNKSFGLTTLRDRHARISRSGAVFEFRGKSGKSRRTGFRDRRLARIVKACQDLPGQRLFQYLDEAGERRSVGSEDVNAYIRDAMGEDFSAKDFRTWAATVLAARALAMDPEGASAKVHMVACIKAVAGLLGNGAAVCRKAYIHPAVLSAYEAGALPFGPPAKGHAFELQVIRFLKDQARAA